MHLLTLTTHVQTFCQGVLTDTSKVGGWRTCTCTGSTSTASWWWFALRLAAFSTCGTRRPARMSSLRTSTRCACRPKPWAKPRTASWGSCSSSERSSCIWTPSCRGKEKYSEGSWAGDEKGGLWWCDKSACSPCGHKTVKKKINNDWYFNKRMTCVIYLSFSLNRKVTEKNT